MAKFSKEKRDQEEYRSILIQNANRKDFICPHCKKSFLISEAKHSRLTRIDDVVWPPFSDMPHTESVPCYAYRFDSTCLKKLERNDKYIGRFIVLWFVLVVIFGIILMFHLKSNIEGWLIHAAYWGGLFMFPIILFGSDEMYMLFSKLYLPTIESIDFDKALKYNAVKPYQGMISSSEKRKLRKQEEEKERQRYDDIIESVNKKLWKYGDIEDWNN